jgi:hypothetical protein
MRTPYPQKRLVPHPSSFEGRISTVVSLWDFADLGDPQPPVKLIIPIPPFRKVRERMRHPALRHKLQRLFFYEQFMNFLFETYEVLYPMIQVRNSQVRNSKDRFRTYGFEPGVMKMFAMAVVTALCVAGVAFCVRPGWVPGRACLVGYWFGPHRLYRHDSELQWCKISESRCENGLHAWLPSIEARTLINREGCLSDVDPGSIRGTIGRTLPPL